MTETWLPVPGWEGLYEVSDMGRVRSVDRILTDGRHCGGVTLAQFPNGKGYLTVVLRGGPRKATRMVHVLVAAAHIGPRPPGEEIRHLNGKQADNRLRNLRYGTHSQNERDKRKTRKNRTGGEDGRGKRRINREERSPGSRVRLIIDLGIPRSGTVGP